MFPESFARISQAPRGTFQGMIVSYWHLGATMDQQAGKQRVVWLTLSSAISGGGPRLLTEWLIVCMVVAIMATTMGATRSGAQARAASCSTSTRGPCAGLPTTPRSLLRAEGKWQTSKTGSHQVCIGFVLGLHTFWRFHRFGISKPDVSGLVKVSIKFIPSLFKFYRFAASLAKVCFRTCLFSGKKGRF